MKNFKPTSRDGGFTAYQNTTGKTLKIRVYYTKGGVNFWNGKTNGRGVYVSVMPVEISHSESGYSSESWMMGQGMAAFVLPLARKNDKAIEAVAEKIDELVPEAFQCATFENCNPALYKILETAFPDVAVRR